MSRRCLDQADDLIWNKHPRQLPQIVPIIFIDAAQYYPPPPAMPLPPSGDSSNRCRRRASGIERLGRLDTTRIELILDETSVSHSFLRVAGEQRL